MILGLVLAGGRSSRFGSDKAQAMLAGRPLLAHAVAALRPHVAAVAVSTGGAMSLLSRHVGSRDEEDPLPVVGDLPRAGLGPLGGIAGGLAYAAEAGFDHLMTLPCDTPRLPDGLLRTLAQGPAPVALEGLPVCGIWSADLGPALVRRLETHDDRSMRGWMAAIGGHWIAHPPIANVNTPADLDSLAAHVLIEERDPAALR